MCQKKPYCGTRIDPCLKNDLNQIDFFFLFKPLLSCCGHGKYPKTIVVENQYTHEIFEYFSHIKLADKPRHPKRYYKKDKNGYYYIPELTEEKQC